MARCSYTWTRGNGKRACNNLSLLLYLICHYHDSYADKGVSIGDGRVVNTINVIVH